MYCILYICIRISRVLFNWFGILTCFSSIKTVFVVVGWVDSGFNLFRPFLVDTLCFVLNLLQVLVVAKSNGPVVSLQDERAAPLLLQPEVLKVGPGVTEGVMDNDVGNDQEIFTEIVCRVARKLKTCSRAMIQLGASKWRVLFCNLVVEKEYLWDCCKFWTSVGCPSLISGCLASNEYALGIASLSLLGRCLSDEPNYGKFIQVASGSEANEGI